MIRPMTQEERERATERRLTNMTTSKSICEIRLHNAMIRNNLTLEECINAIDTYAMDKKFHDDLDSLYNVEQDKADGAQLEFRWDDWHDGDIK